MSLCCSHVYEWKTMKHNIKCPAKHSIIEATSQAHPSPLTFLKICNQPIKWQPASGLLQLPTTGLLLLTKPMGSFTLLPWKHCAAFKQRLLIHITNQAKGTNIKMHVKVWIFYLRTYYNNHNFRANLDAALLNVTC